MVDARAVRAWLEVKGIEACGMCRSSDLQISKGLYAVVSVHPTTGAPDVGHGSRVVRIRCGGCAHLMFFHARQMGLE